MLNSRILLFSCLPCDDFSHIIWMLHRAVNLLIINIRGDSSRFVLLFEMFKSKVVMGEERKLYFNQNLDDLHNYI